MSLVSAGVSVTITNDSFFIPSGASTVPLFFVATASEKLQPNAEPALSTYEYEQVRTITSQEQSVRNYGVPIFKQDGLGNPLHGDSRNEYGLLAINQFLGLGNRCYVVRANVNLNADDDLGSEWDLKINNTSAYGVAQILESYVEGYILDANQFKSPGDLDWINSVPPVVLLSLIHEALEDVFGMRIDDQQRVVFAEATFSNVRPSFIGDNTITPLKVYSNGFDDATTGDFLGLEGAALDWVSNGMGAEPGEWTPIEASQFLIDQATLYRDTVEFVSNTSLGEDDAARRVKIVKALNACIASNQEVRSERYEYNLILCPGFPEAASELLTLDADIGYEALVLGDTPMDKSPETVVDWGVTPDRKNSDNIAYYYPHGLAMNLDGNEVLAASSGIALRTITYSDETSELWLAPAGTRRGLVTGISRTGYYEGTAGTPTKFIDVNLNLGERDALSNYPMNINPIVYFPGRGTIVWGQKTSAVDASALDRINVARLVAYIKRQLRKNTMSFLFEPNDQLTRDSLKAVVDSFLGDLVVRRGLYDFASICDESNNTPDRIDRNELYIDIAIKPVKAVEFLYIPIRIVNTGADI